MLPGLGYTIADASNEWTPKYSQEEKKGNMQKRVTKMMWMCHVLVTWWSGLMIFHRGPSTQTPAIDLNLPVIASRT